VWEPVRVWPYKDPSPMLDLASMSKHLPDPTGPKQVCVVVQRKLALTLSGLGLGLPLFCYSCKQLYRPGHVASAQGETMI
jgi:hypothetical protein